MNIKKRSIEDTTPVDFMLGFFNLELSDKLLQIISNHEKESMIQFANECLINYHNHIKGLCYDEIEDLLYEKPDVSRFSEYQFNKKYKK